MIKVPNETIKNPATLSEDAEKAARYPVAPIKASIEILIVSASGAGSTKSVRKARNRITGIKKVVFKAKFTIPFTRQSVESRKVNKKRTSMIKKSTDEAEMR